MPVQAFVINVILLLSINDDHCKVHKSKNYEENFFIKKKLKLKFKSKLKLKLRLQERCSECSERIGQQITFRTYWKDV